MMYIINIINFILNSNIDIININDEIIINFFIFLHVFDGRNWFYVYDCYIIYILYIKSMLFFVNIYVAYGIEYIYGWNE